MESLKSRFVSIMKKWCYALISMLLAVALSCQKRIETAYREDVISSEEAAFIDFARILSEAVYNEPSLRSFIKQEALKYTDKDTDVFYPWVKDKVIDDGRTFREVLKLYDHDGKLEEIESTVELLNILVPDWSWFYKDCFSPEKWDETIEDVAVTIKSANLERPVFVNGNKIGLVYAGNYTDQPTLIVKNNERIIVSGKDTKAGGKTYKFYDEEFDGTKGHRTKGSFYSETYTDVATIATNKVPGYSISQKVRQAYQESLGAYYLPQRDYIYYDMTASRDSGSVDIHFKERLYKFKFSSADIVSLYDDTGRDPKLLYSENPGTYYTPSQSLALLWDEGHLEVIFNIRYGNTSVKKNKDIALIDAFKPTKVVFQYYKNVFGTITWRSYSTEAQYLVPKWIDMNQDLFVWDLHDYPHNYEVSVEEKDSGTSQTRSITRTNRYAMNFKLSASFPIKVLKIGLDLGTTADRTQTDTVSETYISGSDDLGSFQVAYNDPIIVGQDNSDYSIYQYSTGSVDVLILPYKYY